MGKRLFMLVAGLMLWTGLLTAQPTSVSGVVVSAEDGTSVIGASVVFDGFPASYGAITDLDGRFTLGTIPQGAERIIVSCIGMQTQAAVISGNQMRIVLEPDVTVLEGTVVTALGITRSEKALGYAATKVESEDIAGQRNTNPLNSLSGKVAGMQINATSSNPGAANSVIIRGFGSINGSNQPLYVVDGVPLRNNSLQTQQSSLSLSGISNIASDDIESMTVLKGAAATALYGSRAANGVIIITTKSGSRSGGKNFSIEYNGGVQLRQVSLLPDMQNDFGQGWDGGQTYIENGSWGPRLDGSTQVYGPIWNNQQLIHEYSAKVNNVKDFFDLGVSHNHNISFNGVSADNSATYYVSYSYTADDGIMPTDADKYTRNTISARTTFEPAKWVRLSSSLNLATAKTDVVGSFQGTSVIDGLLEMPRDVSIVDMADLSSAFNTPEAYYTPYGITNPYWAIENNYNHTDSKQIYGKIQADVKPFKDLTLTYRFGFDYMDYDTKIGYPQIALDDALIGSNYGVQPSYMNTDGSVYSAYVRTYDLNHDIMASYSKNFLDGKLSLNAIVGMNIWERYQTGMSGNASVLTFETGFWDLSNASNWTSLSEGQSQRRLIGLFGDVTIGWDDMVYLDLTARNDWSSTLPVGNNDYFYPGATLSWVFSELIPKNNVLTHAKARVAYGRTGNDASAYLTSATFVQGYSHGYYQSDIITFPLNGQNAFQSSSTVGSSTLRPEMTTEFEAGLNMQFFGGRLGFDAAYYNRVTSDQIFTLPVDPSTGYSYMVTNFGDVRNRGIELLVNTTPIRTRNFRWDLDFNFALNRNKVLSMPESLEGGRVTINGFSAGDDAVYMYAEEGRPIGTFYTYMPQYVTDESSPYCGCQIVDAAGMPVLSDAVEDTGMDMNHKWTGGITTSFSAFGFTLSATLDVRLGGYMFSRTRNLMQFTGNGVVTTYNDRRPFIIPNSVVATTDDSGATTYTENTSVIMLTDDSMQLYYNNYGYGLGGLNYMQDRSYAKLRNISLSYDFPKKWMQKAHLQGISLSAFVNNAFIWTAADNFYIDPESTTEGTDLAGMFGELYSNPSCRIYGFNLNIKF